MPWYALSVLYLIIWSALLVHCLFQQEFYPIFGRRLGTKCLWLSTFVFLNPLLTLIYFVFGFLLSFWKVNIEKRGDKQKTVSLGLGSAISIALIGIVAVFFELSSSSGAPEPVVVKIESEKNKFTEQEDLSGKFKAHLGTINAKNKIQTFGSSSDKGTRVSMGNIMIISQSPHELLDFVLRQFQQSLVRLPYVDDVSYYPYGVRPEQGCLLPDVFVIVNMPHVIEKSFIHSRYFKAIVKWTAGSSIFAGTSHSNQTDAFKMLRFDIENQLEHESDIFEFEGSLTKYDLAADSICKEMIKSIDKQLKNLLDKHNRIPDIPDVLHGIYHEPPKFSFLETEDVQQLISGRGLSKNNHTVWRFAENRPIDKALAGYRDEMKSLGWGKEDLGDDYLRMHKGNEHIHIFNLRRRDTKTGTVFWDESEKKADETVMIADYISGFDEDQIQRAMEALSNSDQEVKIPHVLE